ncbi:hypothetical protein LUZ61_007251 [Rhynchospora tenuis]|uniref:non-specific serine/threonine protein kinase n=1 Tax=Rhynchospora tenuis TaxID=198213 RepID=A0AAD5ZT73_9POAL|nr:hypothetical protein LUZ61_007251 [Rhynchospora tenuis]
MSILLRFITAVPLLLLFSLSADAVGSAGTLAISSGADTVCGISFRMLPRTVLCVNISESASTNSPYLLLPNVSVDSVSAGTSLFCALKSCRRVFFCENGDPVNRMRVYMGSWSLSDLTVGETQVAALDTSAHRIRWWRKEGVFPSSVHGQYSSLTSGNDVTCAITTKGRVNCWGPLANAMQDAFSGSTMISIVAGHLHMCGLDISGFVICQGSNSSGQSFAPHGFPFEFTGFALGSNHTCAIKQPRGTAVCWGGPKGAHLYTPVNLTSFEFLVAGGTLTCGLMSKSYGVVCWESDWSKSSVRTVLLRILPGICVSDRDECKCGIYPESRKLCAGTGVVCQRCYLIPLPSELEKIGKVWKVEVAVGTIGYGISVCGVVYIMWFVFCKKKVHIDNQIRREIAPAVAISTISSGSSNSESDTNEELFHLPSTDNGRLVSSRRMRMPQTLELHRVPSTLNSDNGSQLE